jgi:hypothetical protein
MGSGFFSSSFIVTFFALTLFGEGGYCESLIKVCVFLFSCLSEAGVFGFV